jgi:FGGY-family pentulose kinase
MAEPYFIGCDIGTGSARVGIFSSDGQMLAVHSEDIKIWRPRPDYVEQSSEDIWSAFCTSTKIALGKSGIKSEQVKGIGFDATCSLVVLDKEDKPVTVSPDSNDQQNIIVWMDHRAIQEAEYINQTQHEVLQYVGGKISPEMQTPKLLWLKRNMPETWRRGARFFDLADYMVYRSTGEDVRSVCTTTCKWTYLAHESDKGSKNVGTWNDSYFKRVGLEEVTEQNYRRIGNRVREVGAAVGNGLTVEAAEETGLPPNTPVAVSIIDAHAGGIGLLGIDLKLRDQKSLNLDDRLALIGGTSSCHMAVSQDPRFIEGVWGPYYSAMLPGFWLNEGGQSATGSLIDHIIFSSKESIELQAEAARKEKTVYEVLNDEIDMMAEEEGLEDVGMLTGQLHILPYFHGNRSPRANPNLKGGISGLRLSATRKDLALQYLSVVQAIAYGTRHIIEEMNRKGYSIQRIMATGGGTKNELFLKQHADICGCRITLPEVPEAVLLGSAILGATASGHFSSVFEGMSRMARAGQDINPVKERVARYHDAKYKVFHKMYEDQMIYGQLMSEQRSVSA